MELTKTTQITVREAQYGRSAYIKLVDDQVVFDCSDGEYGPIQFGLELLEEKIKQHKESYGK
jgi:hypothetical protein